jgi:hypothetical protein
VCLDRFAACRFELHHLVAIAKKDACYGDGGRSVYRQNSKLSIAVPIMHMPAHLLETDETKGVGTDLDQDFRAEMTARHDREQKEASSESHSAGCRSIA